MRIITSKNYSKSYNKNGLNKKPKQLNKLSEYLYLLSQGEILPREARDHKLMKEYKGFREFHIGGDMIVVYKMAAEIISLINVGKHTQIFNSM